MAQRRRRSAGVNILPTGGAGRFIPATALILLGFVLMIVKDISSNARHEQDLITKQGTLTNYSFKKNESGEMTYGIWLQEFSERLVLSSHDAQAFDSAAFKSQVKPGDRVQVQYNRREDAMKSSGNRRLYGLSVPAKNLTYFTGTDTIKREQGGWLTWLTYLFMGLGTALFIYQVIKLKQEEHEA